MTDPADDQVGDRHVVLVQHQHVAVALPAHLGEQQVPRGAARGLMRLDRADASLAPCVAVGAGECLR